MQVRRCWSSSGEILQQTRSAAHHQFRTGAGRTNSNARRNLPDFDQWVSSQCRTHRLCLCLGSESRKNSRRNPPQTDIGHLSEHLREELSARRRARRLQPRSLSNRLSILRLKCLLLRRLTEYWIVQRQNRSAGWQLTRCKQSVIEVSLLIIEQMCGCASL